MSIDCQWSSPGADPYTGSKAAAVAHYVQIPVATREKLLARMLANRPDQVVEIRRDSISGGFEPVITDMHFGKGRVCGTVDRSGWTSYEMQPALVYCEDGHCLIEPVICHNVSYVRRAADPAAVMPPLAFEPPAAGEAEPAAPLTAISTESFDAGLEPAGAGAAPIYLAGPAYPAFGPSLPLIPPGAVSPIPEPSTWALMALGLCGIAFQRRHGALV